MKGVEKLDIKSNLEIISLKVCFKLVHALSVKFKLKKFATGDTVSLAHW